MRRKILSTHYCQKKKSPKEKPNFPTTRIQSEKRCVVQIRQICGRRLTRLRNRFIIKKVKLKNNMSTLEVKENTELEQPKPVEISGSKARFRSSVTGNVGNDFRLSRWRNYADLRCFVRLFRKTETYFGSSRVQGHSRSAGICENLWKNRSCVCNQPSRCNQFGDRFGRCNDR